MKRLDTYKRILLALSERKVPRVHALILAELNDGSSPRTILGAIQKAVEGKRKATSYIVLNSIASPFIMIFLDSAMVEEENCANMCNIS